MFDDPVTYDPYPYDPSEDLALSNSLADASWGLWDASIGFQQASIDAWQLDPYTALEYQQMSDAMEWSSHELYQASWDAWYGPVNSEGYTAYDAGMGYTTQDTSLIEPASSAGSMSLISDDDATSWL